MPFFLHDEILVSKRKIKNFEKRSFILNVFADLTFRDLRPPPSQTEPDIRQLISDCPPHAEEEEERRGAKKGADEQKI